MHKIDAEELFEKGSAAGISQKCFRLKSGLKVFNAEHAAVKRLQNIISGKPKISQELNEILNIFIIKLIKADATLAKVAIYDAENLSVENQKVQKKIEQQIEKAKEQLAEAQEYLSKSKSEKAIARFANSWLHTQIALRLANL